MYYENISFKNCFLNNTYACRKGYGTHKAFFRVKKYYFRYKYFLKLDISSFFVSIHRKVLFNILKNDLENITFENKIEIFCLIEKIIFNKYTKNYKTTKNSHLLNDIPSFKSLINAEKINCGLPGNLTSQFFANVYLNKLDYYIVNELNFKNYVRYMDDFIFFSNNCDELESSIKIIINFLKRKLRLHLASKNSIKFN